MNRRNTMRLFAIALALVLVPAVWAAVIVDDQFADGNSQNQDLEKNSLQLFNGRAGTIRIDAVGSVTFDVTGANGADGFWAYFTDTEPVKLEVGDQLMVAGTFSLHGFLKNGKDLRFGLFDSLGTRTPSNRTGGMNHDSFIGDPGYNLQFFASGEGMPLRVGRRIEFASTGILNTAADFETITTEGTGATERQELEDDTLYTLTYTVERLSATETRISVSVTGGKLSEMNWSVVETSEMPNTTFDYFGYRIDGPGSRLFTEMITFTRLYVEYIPVEPPGMH